MVASGFTFNKSVEVQAKAAIGPDVGGTRVKAAGGELIQGLRQRLDQWEWRPGGLRVELAFAKLGEWAGAFGAGPRAMQIC